MINKLIKLLNHVITAHTFFIFIFGGDQILQLIHFYFIFGGDKKAIYICIFILCYYLREISKNLGHSTNSEVGGG